jgi:hypothetical protein
VRHRSSGDLRVHSIDLESILLPLRVEYVDGVLQVMVSGAVVAHLCEPTSVSHYLSIGHRRVGTSMLADHLLLLDDLHGVCELLVPWPRHTLDLVRRGLGDAQLEQQTVKLCGNSR